MVERAEIARLRWRCRRGMRELDMLMAGWLDRHYESACEADQANFRALLEAPDPQLLGWLTGRSVHDDPATAQLIDAIRTRT